MNENSRKKVLFLIPTLGGGGAEKVLVNLVNNLDVNRYDVTVQTIFMAGVNAQFLKSHIKLKQGKLKQFRGNSHLMKLFSPRFLYRWIVGKQYDVAISYLEGPSARIISGCPFESSKLINWIHCTFKSEKEVRLGFRSGAEARAYYSRFDAHAYVSKRVLQQFLKFLPDLKNNNVIYNTNEDDKIRILAEEEVTDYDFSGKKTIVSAGKLVQNKGYERLIKAHVRCIHEGMPHHLLIVGEGDLRNSLQNMVEKMGAGATVHLMGYRANPYKYLSKSDMFVCSSFSEGFSTAVTEALILGKPVVTTLVSGATEQCGENNEYGIVVENSENGLYLGIKELLSDEKKMKHYEEMSKRRGQLFSKSNTVRSVENLIDSLCDA